MKPIRLCWWGPEEGVLGWLNQQAMQTLARRGEIVLTSVAPTVVIMTDPARADGAPLASLHVHYPIGERLPEEPIGTAWAASRWHQKYMPGSLRLPIGALLHEPRHTGPGDEGVVVVIGPDDTEVPAPLLERLAGVVDWRCQTIVASQADALPLAAGERRALWAGALAVVLLPGCDASLPLAVEARSVGVPVLVPKGDPADELLMVPGIGAYGVRLGDLPEPDWAALFMRIDRLAAQDFVVRPTDLSGWHWDSWCDRVVAALQDVVPDDEMADQPMVVVVGSADAAWLVDQVLRPAFRRPTVSVDVLVAGDLSQFAAGIRLCLSLPEQAQPCSHVTFWPAGSSPQALQGRFDATPIKIAGPAVEDVWSSWAGQGRK